MGFLIFLFRWGGGVVMVAAFLIGIPDSFTATRDFVEWASPFGVQPIHLAFWLMGIGAVYTTIIQGIKTRRLEKARPKVTVTPKVKNGRAILEVQNSGGEAEFTAKARAIATVPESELYTMYWESIPGVHCHIDGEGGVASILVAERAKANRLTGEIQTSLFRGSLALFKMGTSGEQVFPAFSGKRDTKIIDGTEVISGRAIDRCIVEVTLTSTPKLKEKWGTHKYLCEIEKGEIKFYETDLSVPHKKGSQN